MAPQIDPCKQARETLRTLGSNADLDLFRTTAGNAKLPCARCLHHLDRVGCKDCQFQKQSSCRNCKELYLACTPLPPSMVDDALIAIAQAQALDWSYSKLEFGPFRKNGSRIERLPAADVARDNYRAAEKREAINLYRFGYTTTPRDWSRFTSHTKPSSAVEDNAENKKTKGNKGSFSRSKPAKQQFTVVEHDEDPPRPETDHTTPDPRINAPQNKLDEQQKCLNNRIIDLDELDDVSDQILFEQDEDPAHPDLDHTTPDCRLDALQDKRKELQQLIEQYLDTRIAKIEAHIDTVLEKVHDRVEKMDAFQGKFDDLQKYLNVRMTKLEEHVAATLDKARGHGKRMKAKISKLESAVETLLEEREDLTAELEKREKLAVQLKKREDLMMQLQETDSTIESLQDTSSGEKMKKRIRDTTVLREPLSAARDEREVVDHAEDGVDGEDAVTAAVDTPMWPTRKRARQSK